MLLKFIRPWAHYEPGQTIDQTAGAAELMIQRGICEKVDDDKPANGRKTDPKRDKPKV